MPKEFDDMVKAVKAQLKKENPNMSDDKLSSKAYAIATDNWKKSHGGKSPSKEKVKDWRILEFYVPIEEKFDDDENFMIKGVAINETTTLNNVTYVAEELERAAPTFRNVPILLDHKNEVRNIVGRTTENVNFNPGMKRIDFEAKIMDKGIKEMIKDGRIGSVSIGAKVDDLQEMENGSMKAIGIRGLEISLVAVPGDSQASLAHALQNSFVLKEMAMKEEQLDKNKNTKEETMAEDETKIESEPSKELEEPKEEAEEPKEEKAEEKVQNINVKVDTTEIAGIKNDIAELKELLKMKKQIKEQLEEEKEDEDETKGEVSEDKEEAEEALEKLDKYIVERAKGGFALYRNYANDTNLKRLVK